MFTVFRIASNAMRVTALVSALTLCAPSLADTGNYAVTNLVADIPGVAVTTDPNLVNGWGITSLATSPIWVSSNGKGVSTL